MEAEILSIVETLDNMPVSVRALLGEQTCVECTSVCISLLARGGSVLFGLSHLDGASARRQGACFRRRGALRSAPQPLLWTLSYSNSLAIGKRRWHYPRAGNKPILRRGAFSPLPCFGQGKPGVKGKLVDAEGFPR